MELLTGRMQFEEFEGEDDTKWEQCSTGRSSNEGLEAWVAKPDGGFRLVGAPPTPVPVIKVTEIPAPKDKARKKGGRSKSKERKSEKISAPEVDLSDAPSNEENLQADEAPLRDGLHGRRKEAASSVASAISNALGLTPGTRQLVARAAELGAAAALKLPPTPLEDEKENVGDISNRDGKKGAKGKKSKKGKGRGSKRGADKVDKELVPPQQVDLSA